jgi:hypothetical protein
MLITGTCSLFMNIHVDELYENITKTCIPCTAFRNHCCCLSGHAPADILTDTSGLRVKLPQTPDIAVSG